MIATTSEVEFFQLELGVDEAVSLYTTGHKMGNNGYSITKVIGSDTGRIFMGTNRGDIIELNYQVRLARCIAKQPADGRRVSVQQKDVPDQLHQVLLCPAGVDLAQLPR